MNTIHIIGHSGHFGGYVDGFVRAARLALGTADRALTKVADGAANWSQRVMDRRALRTLDDHILSDIGLSRADVEQEASKRFWQK